MQFKESAAPHYLRNFAALNIYLCRQTRVCRVCIPVCMYNCLTFVGSLILYIPIDASVSDSEFIRPKSIALSMGPSEDVHTVT